MVFRQVITPGDGEGVPGHTHDASDVSGEAVFTTTRVNKLLSGTITGKVFVVAGGTDGVIKSDNFVAGADGWAVFGDGSAEFSDVTVRGVVIAGAGSSIGFDDVTDGSNVASLTIGSGGTLESSNFVAGTSGWQIDGDGSAEFNDVTVRGDIVSSNWDGAEPVDLSSGADGTATLGFALDSSAGAAQFTGPVYFQPPDEATAGAGDVFSFGDGFSVRVYQGNPTAGEDTLWFLAGTDATDHMVFGPASASSELKSLTLKALSIPIDFGTWAHSFPKGIVYDWGYTGETSGDAVATTLTTVLSVTASVPANVSVSVLAWGFVTFDNEGPISDRRFAQMDVGGTGGILAIAEMDSVAGSGGAVSTGANTTTHTHQVTHSGIEKVWDGISAHVTGSHVEGNESAGHAHVGGAHTHAMDSVWQTLSPLFQRSFTPAGTTVTVNLRVQTEGSSETFANKALMYMVLVN